MAERRAINKRIRENVFEFLEKKGVKYIPSETNFFMMEVGRPGAEFAKAMAEQKVMIGRVWPAWPTKVRVTVGTQEEMDKFKAASDKIVLTGRAGRSLQSPSEHAGDALQIQIPSTDRFATSPLTKGELCDTCVPPFCFAAALASAQSFQGSLRGRVIDPKAPPFPCAKITLSTKATGAARSTLTSDQGEYTFAAAHARHLHGRSPRRRASSEPSARASWSRRRPPSRSISRSNSAR